MLYNVTSPRMKRIKTRKAITKESKEEIMEKKAQKVKMYNQVAIKPPSTLDITLPIEQRSHIC